MKRQIKILILGMLLLVLLSGCSTKNEEMGEGPFLFYVNAERTALRKESYKIKEKDQEKAVENMLEKLAGAPKSLEMKTAISNGVKVKKFKIEENQLHLYMNEAYLEQDRVSEMLCRSAIVQSLTQIDGIEMVDFYVENEPLLTKNGEPVGLMRADSFVQDTGTALKSYQNTELTLFFANKKGDGLITEKRNVRYLSNVSMEKLVIEQLMKGPKTKDAKSILSPDTKILNVSVKDGICYVNFDRKFLEQTYDVKPKVVIYGIVNSVIGTGNVSWVQISVEGKTTVKFQESVKLNEPFDRNLELVEEKEE